MHTGEYEKKKKKLSPGKIGDIQDYKSPYQL